MKKNFELILFLIAIIIVLPSCVKKSKISKNSSNQDLKLLPYEERLLLEEEKTTNHDTEEKKATNNKYELDFKVKNKTGKTIYVVGFSYINKRSFNRWRWDKSPIYKLENNQETIIDVDTINDDEHRKNIYGTLGVFNSLEKAKNSTYELLKEKHRLDLDKLHKLRNKTVKINIRKYGFKGKILEFKIDHDTKDHNELDFLVENKTGKNLWICSFIYQKKNDMPIWNFAKTSVKLVKNNKSVIIDVDTFTSKYDKVFMLGFLAVFDEKQKEEAEKITYELLKPENKIGLGRLASLRNKKIVLEIEQYGLKNNFLDISIKPTRKIFK